MAHPEQGLRTRAIGLSHLRAFEAVAWHLSFRAAADDLALTQSAVTRQIQALEDDLGVSLFLRHTRAVELTRAGAQLLQTVRPALAQLYSTVQSLRRHAGRQSVTLTTTASIASMWLIHRLEDFQSRHPDIDIRIDASDVAVDLDTCDVDLALRYTQPSSAPLGARRLFG